MKTEIEDALELLYPMENLQKSSKRFAAGRRRKLLCVGGVFLGLMLCLQLQKPKSALDAQGKLLQRPDKGKKQVELTVDNGQMQTDITVELVPRKRSEKEAEEIFDKLGEALPGIILGGNASMQEITEKLYLPGKLDEYGVTLYWSSSDNRRVTSDGTVHNRELSEPEEIILGVRMNCDGYERKEQLYVKVLPYPYSEQQILQQEMEMALAKSQEDTAEKEVLALPQSLDGEPLQWSEKQQNHLGFFGVIGVLVILLLYLREESVLKQQLEKREEELMADYPDFISKFILLLSSGLNIRGIWERMAQEYRDSKRKQYVYEEMLRAQAQMEVGMPESRAYEMFGRRCGQLGYLRFSTILVQNLYKGSRGILQLMQEEAAAAFSERKALARIKGEKAGTKLLLPMGGMLVLVFAVILIPAFASFQL